MKSKLINIFWGIVLIIVSGILVAEALGYVSFGSVTRRDWAMVCGVASAVFFLTYLLSGVKQWGWLFPALICAAMGWHNVRTGRFFDPLSLDWPMLAALAVPFYVGFVLDRKRWGLLIPAYILTVPAFLDFSNEMITGLNLVTGANRTFLLTFFTGAGQMFLFALPFFVIYLRSKKNWWALMPAGGFASVGLMLALSILIPRKGNELVGLHNAIVLLGLAVTLGVLWLRRATQPTDWAKYPAVGLLILAIAAVILGKGWVDLAQDFKAIIFVVGSAAFFLAYLLHGVSKWGWLFPACACAATALMIWMETRAIEGSITAVPLFAGAALPFFVGFAVNRKRRGLLIPATLLTAFTIFLLIEGTVPGDWSGAIFFFLLALPFFVTYFWSTRNWWALIPAGGLASFGLVVLVDILIPHQEYPTLPNTMSWDVFIWVLFLGLAATFGAIWLHHKTRPTEWAKYPAAGLLGVGLLSMLLRENFQQVWPATVTLVVGVVLLLVALNRKKTAADQHTFGGKA